MIFNFLIYYKKISVFFMAVIFSVACSSSNENLDVNKVNDQLNLIIACVNGSLDEVKLYSSKLDTVNFVSIKGDTPLNAATENGRLEVVKILIEHGADPYLKDSYGLSAVETAKKSEYQNILQLFSTIN